MSLPEQPVQVPNLGIWIVACTSRNTKRKNMTASGRPTTTATAISFRLIIFSDSLGLVLLGVKYWADWSFPRYGLGQERSVRTFVERRQSTQ
jgi:hypothetical protein